MYWKFGDAGGVDDAAVTIGCFRGGDRPPSSSSPARSTP